MTKIQFFHQGIEYTTRHELALKYHNMSHIRLQRLLENNELVRVPYKNLHYFEKESTEAYIDAMCPIKDLPAALLAALEAGCPADAGYWA